jgi:hypothetical protein
VVKRLTRHEMVSGLCKWRPSYDSRTGRVIVNRVQRIKERPNRPLLNLQLQMRYAEPFTALRSLPERLS